MSNVLKVVLPNTVPLSTDVSQFALLLQGLLDAGDLVLLGPQIKPTTSIADSGISGNPNGNYYYKVIYITGWKQSDNTYYVRGFAPSDASSLLAVTNHKINVSIPIGGNGVIGRAIYRTSNNGAIGTEKFVAIVWDNVTTTYVDNVADASLGSGMPTVNGTSIPSNVPTENTTGTKLKNIDDVIDSISLGGIY